MLPEPLINSDKAGRGYFPYNAERVPNTFTRTAENDDCSNCGPTTLDSKDAEIKAKPTSFSVLMETDFERCRGNLRAAFCSCTQSEFAMLNVLMSGVLNGFRPLDKYELYGLLALSLNTGADENGDFVIFAEMLFEFSHSHRRPDCNQDNRRDLFLIHEDGMLDFRDQSMRQFLTTYTIQGLDLTHRIMADACLRQLEMDNDVSHPLFRAYRSKYLSYASAFSSYATEFWGFHCRQVQAPCPLLLERVHQLIYTLSHQSVAFHERCTWLAPCEDVANAAIEYCMANNLETLVEPYIRISTSAENWRPCIDRSDAGINSEDEHLSAALSQLGFNPPSKCVGYRQSGLPSPGSEQISVHGSWSEEEMWIFV